MKAKEEKRLLKFQEEETEYKNLIANFKSDIERMKVDFQAEKEELE